jgi:hypothetical protein
VRFATVLVRTLKPGKTYDDFVAAWYPDQGFGVEGMGPVLATNAANERELLAFGIFDIPEDTSLDDVMARIAEQESARHDRIAEIIESTQLRGIYEVRDEYDFSTDAAVAATRPPGLSR